jgi:hypothetical protein
MILLRTAARTMQLGIVAQEVFSSYRFNDWESH